MTFVRACALAELRANSALSGQIDGDDVAVDRSGDE